MDPVTHGLAGFFIAMLLAKKLGFENLKWPLVAGVVAGLAPDIDTISYFFGESGFYTYHRVATHSLIGIVLLAFIIAVFFSRLKKDKFIRYLPLAMLGLLSHLFLDFVTAFSGSQIFYPFSTAKIALNISPGVDVYLLALLAAGIVVYKMHPEKHARIAATVILFALLIFSARFALTNYAELRADSINGDSYLTPDIFNPFKWHVVKESSNGYLISDYTLGLGISEPLLMAIKDDPAVQASKNSNLVSSFLNFANFPYPFVDGNKVQWVDLKQTRGSYGGFTATVQLDENLNVIMEEMGI